MAVVESGWVLNTIATGQSLLSLGFQPFLPSWLLERRDLVLILINVTDCFANGLKQNLGGETVSTLAGHFRAVLVIAEGQRWLLGRRCSELASSRPRMLFTSDCPVASVGWKPFR
jgi:hypothetical protein